MSSAEMPPAPSLSTGDQDEELAFQVINQDNLPIAVIGQPILKPFDPEAQKFKPNVIVHPTRRITNNLEENKQRGFTKSSGQININNSNDRIRKNISTSHGNLCHNNSTAQMKLEDLNDQLDVDKFTKTLDSKLKRLQRSELKQQKLNNFDPPTSRKPFVTTVKKGQFLEPPPEIASLIGIKVEEPTVVKKNPKEVKKLYAFASRPRILSRTPPRTVHQTRCQAAAFAAAKLVGTVVGIRHENEKIRDAAKIAHPVEKKGFKDLSPTSDEQPKWNPNFAFAKLLSCDEADRNLSAVRSEQAQRRALARKKARNQQTIRSKQTVQSLNAVPEHLQKKLLDLSQLQHLLVAKVLSDAATQTDFTISAIQSSTDHDLPKADAQIQVHPTDLFDFNTEVQPIVEILVTKTIEEALIEVLEEEELLTMKEQQRRFLEYMASKSNDDSLEQDNDFKEEILKGCSNKIVKNNYMPNLITSV